MQMKIMIHRFKNAYCAEKRTIYNTPTLYITVYNAPGTSIFEFVYKIIKAAIAKSKHEVIYGPWPC